MRQCDICGEQDALIHVQQIFDGEVREIHLCADCARERGLGDMKRLDGSSLSDLVGALTGNLFQAAQGGDLSAYLSICPGCGRSLHEVLETGEMGCPECYQSFQRTIQGRVRSSYSGSIPEGLKAIKALLVDRRSLEDALRKALEQEEYEKAAALRDEIEKIQHGI